ncbi:MAG TPA: 5-formyltetrahydrofolate cyclo-ligase [Polyangiaceae bacterium]|jgi:5-formyltetrahydrofolate cyclo-ligase
MSELDPKLVAAIVPRAKRQIRKSMRALRSAYPRAALEERSRRIVARVSERQEFVRARSVGLFWPLLERAEVDTRPLHAAARLDGKAVYYPFAESAGDRLITGFRRADDSAELAERGRGFVEPDPARPAALRGELDVIVVPAVAASSSGDRLGYGMGFYDVTLPDFAPPAITLVVVFEFQLLAEVPTLPHDVRCHYVVTEERVLPAPPP